MCPIEHFVLNKKKKTNKNIEILSLDESWNFFLFSRFERKNNVLPFELKTDLTSKVIYNSHTDSEMQQKSFK